MQSKRHVPQCVPQLGTALAKTTEADPDPVNEPCYSHSSCRRVAGSGTAYVCCVAVGTCDTNHVSTRADYYVGGCKGHNYGCPGSSYGAAQALGVHPSGHYHRWYGCNSSTSTSNLFPTQTEGCVKQGECNLPYLEQMKDWTTTGGPLTHNRVPDASMDRLLAGATENGNGCRGIYNGYPAATAGATNKVTMAVVVSGTVESFTTSVLDAMEAKVALSLGVHANDVTITAAAGSVVLTTQVMTTSAAASGLQASMTTLMGTSAAATTALSTTAFPVTASTVIAPTTSAASDTVTYNLQDGNLVFVSSAAAQSASGVSTGAIVIIIVGAIVGILLGLALLWYLMKKTPKTGSGNKGVA